MNNFDKFKNYTIDELAQWIDSNGNFDGSPWMNSFSRKYCDNCEPIMCHYVESEYPQFPCSFCELEKHCKFFPDMEYTPDNFDMIKMWLLEE